MLTAVILETWVPAALEAGAPVGTVRGGVALAGDGGGGTFAGGVACFAVDVGVVTVVVVVVAFGDVLIFVALLRCVTGVVCGLAFCFIFTFVPLPLDEIPREEPCCTFLLLSVTDGL